MDQRDPIDLQDGAAGIALAHAFAGDADRARTLIEQAEDALAEAPLPLDLFTGRNEPVDEPPELLPPHQREVAPAGFFNLGVAAIFVAGAPLSI